MIQTSLSLLVLRTADLDRSVRFYRALGLQFAEEQHGDGPVHYSCALGQTILELYPAKPGSGPDSATRIGFRVDSVAETMQRLVELEVEVRTPPSKSPTSSRAIVLDPDRRTIEIQQTE